VAFGIGVAAAICVIIVLGFSFLGHSPESPQPPIPPGVPHVPELPQPPNFADDVRATHAPGAEQSDRQPHVPRIASQHIAIRSGPPLDERPWKKADFIAINPTHYAVAIARTTAVAVSSSSTYVVLPKAEDDTAQEATGVAFDSGVPIVTDDPPLTRAIYNKTEVGRTVDDSARDEINAKWRERLLVPPNAELAVFNDLKLRTRRAGYLFKDAGGTQLFRDLSSNKPEPFREELVQPGSLQSRLGEKEFRLAANFFDYCMYHVAQKLSSQPGECTYLNVAVIPDQEASHEFAVRGPRSRREGGRRPGSSELSRLTGEIQSFLAAIEVPIVDRSVTLARALSRETKLSYRTAREMNLVGASHLVIFGIGPPQGRGPYELSMRLVSVRSGRILWEDQGDRVDSSEESIELAATPYLLNTGKLATLEFSGEKMPETPATEAWLYGGFPLRQPAITLIATEGSHAKAGKLRKARLIYEPLSGLATCLGYVERSDESKVEFRNLFSKDVQQLDASGVQVHEVTSDSEIPSAHQMRYVVWRLAKAIMPLAGRVKTITGKQFVLDLSQKDGIHSADRLAVVRTSSGEAGGGTLESVQPEELLVVQASDSGSTAICDQQGAESKIKPGDIVYRRPAAKTVVAFLGLAADINNVPQPVMQQLRRNGISETGLRDLSQDIGNRCIDALQTALVGMRLPVVERKSLTTVLAEQEREGIDPDKAAEIGRLHGATHVVLGEISPGLGNEAPITLRVVDVSSGKVVDQVQFSYKRGQLDYWKP
jgi:TolB-like protein